MKKTRNGMSWLESAKLAGQASKKRKEEKEKTYNENPRKCDFCQKAIPYSKRRNKFCSRSCSASLNNKNVRRNQILGTRIINDCLCCGKKTTNPKHCSNTCLKINEKKIRKERIIKNQRLISSKDKWFLEETRGKKCEFCLNEKWLNNEIPLDMHHLDGNSDNNELSNLKLLCPNCHRTTENHGSKNKNGRSSRRKIYRNKRYKSGLSY